MFLVAITHSGIENNFQNFNVEKFRKGGSIITVVTDNFMSKIVPEPEGFSVIESPLISNENFMGLIFSQVKFNESLKVLEIRRPTLSGRAIYYLIDSKGDLFVSMHVSMLRKAGVKIEENQSVLPEFFVYRYVMPPQTLYKNIEQLAAGGKLRINFFQWKMPNCVQISVYTSQTGEN